MIDESGAMLGAEWKRVWLIVDEAMRMLMYVRGEVLQGAAPPILQVHFLVREITSQHVKQMWALTAKDFYQVALVEVCFFSLIQTSTKM